MWWVARPVFISVLLNAADLPGSKYEPSTQAPYTRSHSGSLHTVHPQGTTERHKGRKLDIRKKRNVQSVVSTKVDIAIL